MFSFFDVVVVDVVDVVVVVVVCCFFFVEIDFSFTLDDKLAVHSSLLLFFGSNQGPPVFLWRFKLLMCCMRYFSIVFSFSMTVLLTYSFVFACLTTSS